MFRDEWVKPASAPLQAAQAPARRCIAVRSPDEIHATLNWRGKRDGLKFMPEMYRWTGQRFRVSRKIECVVERGHATKTRAPFYVLEGLRCAGTVLGRKAPCDRACSILWHADWLIDAG